MTASETTPDTTSPVARRTAVGSMLLWGLLHVVGGIALIAAASGSGADAIGAYASGMQPVELTDSAGQAVTAIVGFHGFNIAAAGAAVAVLAWLRRNDVPLRWRTPLIVATLADIGLVVFLLAPGVMAATDGAPGIVLLLVALGATAATHRT